VEVRAQKGEGRGPWERHNMVKRRGMAVWMGRPDVRMRGERQDEHDLIVNYIGTRVWSIKISMCLSTKIRHPIILSVLSG
jgi:hypothetical protein